MASTSSVDDIASAFLLIKAALQAGKKIPDSREAFHPAYKETLYDFRCDTDTDRDYDYDQTWNLFSHIHAACQSCIEELLPRLDLLGISAAC